LISISLLSKDVEHLHVFASHLYFIWKVSVQFICPFIDWFICSFLLNFLSSFNILDINLSYEYLAKIFSHSVCCLFTWLFLLLCKGFSIWCNRICQFLFLFLEQLEFSSEPSCLFLYLEVFLLCFSLVVSKFQALC
jgi:hypothetical protein